jgi:hypothetical protein
MAVAQRTTTARTPSRLSQLGMISTGSRLPVTRPPHWRVRRAMPAVVTWSAPQPTIPTAPRSAALHQGTTSVCTS